MIFIDSSAFIACFVTSDINHSKVEELFHDIAENKLVTSTDIIDETLNWLTRKVSPRITNEIGKILMSEEIANIVESTKEDKYSALEIIKKYSDHKLSFTDAVSFALMKRLEIKEVFSLDKDFNLLRGVKNIFFS